jgi:hypothetical protein
MEAKGKEMADEVKRLKACINDLTSVLALPAIWNCRGPCQVVTALLDLLLGILRLDFAYAKTKDPFSHAQMEMVRFREPGEPPVKPQEIGQALNPWLSTVPHPSPLVVRNPAGAGDVSIAPIGLGLNHELGWVVAGRGALTFQPRRKSWF